MAEEHVLRNPPLIGHAYVADWFTQHIGQEVTRGIVQQFLIFYGILIVGFGFLVLMMRSTTQIRELRRSVAAAIHEQRNRKFDLDDFRAMPGSGML